VQAAELVREQGEAFDLRGVGGGDPLGEEADDAEVPGGIEAAMERRVEAVGAQGEGEAREELGGAHLVEIGGGVGLEAGACLHAGVDEEAQRVGEELAGGLVGEVEGAGGAEGAEVAVAGEGEGQAGELVLAIGDAELEEVDDVGALAQAGEGGLGEGFAGGGVLTQPGAQLGGFVARRAEIDGFGALGEAGGQLGVREGEAVVAEGFLQIFAP
jgi:hypothetical protein